MSEARDEIFAQVRAAISKNLDATLESSQSRFAEAKNRINDHPVNLVPARGRLGKKARVDLFIREAERVNATVVRVSGLSLVPREVVKFLTNNNLPMLLKVSPETSEKRIAWKNQTLLKVSEGRADGKDFSSFSLAYAGVAETGTLVVLSGRKSPTTLNFLPPCQICMVYASHILGSYEEVWARLRDSSKNDGSNVFLPRNVNWITGPSRTADIEQTILLGAHGPQRLHVVIIDD
ncbi:MAG: lactate utilization protein [Pseudomonadota bacterium]|nr:lactate utilization protein [Pseudomonadota bacterium]